jgi:hypothetical protein
MRAGARLGRRSGLRRRREGATCNPLSPLLPRSKNALSVTYVLPVPTTILNAMIMPNVLARHVAGSNLDEGRVPRRGRTRSSAQLSHDAQWIQVIVAPAQASFSARTDQDARSIRPGGTLVWTISAIAPGLGKLTRTSIRARAFMKPLVDTSMLAPLTSATHDGVSAPNRRPHRITAPRTLTSPRPHRITAPCTLTSRRPHLNI